MQFCCQVPTAIRRGLSSVSPRAFAKSFLGAWAEASPVPLAEGSSAAPGNNHKRSREKRLMTARTVFMGNAEPSWHVRTVISTSVLCISYWAQWGLGGLVTLWPSQLFIAPDPQGWGLLCREVQSKPWPTGSPQRLLLSLQASLLSVP